MLPGGNTRDNQVARDSQLRDTAQDYFCFVTKFFEPINVSAAHVYHSALELCPISSIVRKLYYDQCHGVTRFPRVVIGTPDSWDTVISASGKHGYGSCIWSPCGQFIAAQTGQTVEIRNPLTFELLTVLKSTKYKPPPMSPLAYSPDGRSLATGFSGGIVIWDIQTGGVAKKIRCNKGQDIASLVWSLDGSMVAITLNSWGVVTDVKTYNVFSGAQLFTKQFESSTYIYLWAHEKYFRFMKAVKLLSNITTLECTISEIGPTLIEIESSSLTTDNPYYWKISEIAFSPSTYHIAALGNSIFVYDIRTSRRLLEDRGSPTSFQFSPDGSHFASFHKDGLRVFRCTSGSYTLLWKSLLGHENTACLRFSPTCSSILSQHDGILQVRRLSDLPIASGTHPQHTAISRSGRRIATTHRHKTTVSIVDLHSRAPSLFIDTGFEVWGLVIAGNVLVATGCDRAMGWLLTEGGTVEGVSDDQRASDSDSKWTLHVPPMRDDVWNYGIDGVVGAVWVGHFKIEHILRYHIETGEDLKFYPEPQHSRSTSPQPIPPRSTPPQLPTQGRSCHDLHPTISYDTLPKDGWLISNGTRPEAAWIIDPEGVRRFWVPVEWRKSWHTDSWHLKSTTLLGEKEGRQSIAIKF